MDGWMDGWSRPESVQFWAPRKMCSGFQILEEEKENLRKLEDRARNLAEEAAHAAEMEASLASAEGIPGAEGAVSAAAALQERQREAEERLSRLRKAIQGPPQLQACLRCSCVTTRYLLLGSF